jgi:hypothetical protein
VSPGFKPFYSKQGGDGTSTMSQGRASDCRQRGAATALTRWVARDAYVRGRAVGADGWPPHWFERARVGGGSLLTSPDEPRKRGRVGGCARVVAQSMPGSGQSDPR